MNMSDSDVETSGPAPRLGACEVCGSKQALYSCPKCEVKTCGLDCVRVHKNELICDGIRDRTKFIRVKEFSDRDYYHDYRMLEECARFVFAVKRDEKKRFTRIDRDLPIHLFKLKMAARDRGVALQFLAQNFTRHRANTTRYNYKSNLISWRIEWVFANAEPTLKMVDEKCLETLKVSDILMKYLDVNGTEGSALMSYKAVGVNGVKVLMRAEKIRSCSQKYFELDLNESLAENLSGKCVVEFPVLIVVLRDHAYNFETVAPEDDIEGEEDSHANEKEINNSNANKYNNTPNKGENSNANTLNNSGQNEALNKNLNKVEHNINKSNNHFHPRKRQLLTEKVAIEKQKEIRKEIKEDRKKRAKNLLFTTGYSSEEDLEISDDEKL